MGGVLPSQTIRRLMASGNITGIDERFINPGSLDMPAADEIYRLEKTFMPQGKETVRELLPRAGAIPHNFTTPLEVGVSYLVLLKGSIELFEHVYAYGNPKSSSGRLNLFVRAMADGMSWYDMLSPGWKGETWMLVQPRSFPVRLSPGIPLMQFRFFDEKAFLDQTGLQVMHKESGLFFDRNGEKLALTAERAHADALFMSIRADGGIVGWECAGTNKVLDLSSRNGAYLPEEFSFRPVEARNKEIVLLSDVFYILTTEESVRVSPMLSAELRPVDVRLGEFRSHFAGFIDAGWGCGKDSDGKGQPITLEISTTERQLSLRHLQPVARIRFERMAQPPDVPYDSAPSNYTGQANAKLSKLFHCE
jgi:dCTP deaminase